MNTSLAVTISNSRKYLRKFRTSQKRLFKRSKKKRKGSSSLFKTKLRARLKANRVSALLRRSVALLQSSKTVVMTNYVMPRVVFLRKSAARSFSNTSRTSIRNIVNARAVTNVRLKCHNPCRTPRPTSKSSSANSPKRPTKVIVLISSNKLSLKKPNHNRALKQRPNRSQRKKQSNWLRRRSKLR